MADLHLRLLSSPLFDFLSAGGLGGIVLSWISSPLLAGLLAIGSHRVCNRLLDGPNPKQQARREGHAQAAGEVEHAEA